MPQFEVTLNTVVPGCPGAGVSIRRTVVAPDRCAATARVVDGVVSDGMVGIWCVRRRGLLGLGRRWSGRLDLSGGDGLAGVREPRRPRPTGGAGAMELDVPAA